MKCLTAAVLLLLLNVFACSPDEPAVTTPDSFTGSWKVRQTISTFYTDSTETDRQMQSGMPDEIYQFSPDGHFILRQGDSLFKIEGDWQLNRQHTRLTLKPYSGECMNWQVQTFKANQLVLSYENTAQLNGHSYRIKVLTTCVR